MSLKFRESKLDDSFSKKDIEQIENLIQRSISFTLSGMPGVGGSIFLRYLASRSFAYFIYIDTYMLPEISKLSFYQLLLKSLCGSSHSSNIADIMGQCQEKLLELTSTHQRVVIIFNRFDQMKDFFDNQLFTDLINLHNIDESRIVFIFTANRPYSQFSPEGISADKINLMSKVVYLKPYSLEDLQKLVDLTGQRRFLSSEFLKKALELSGGHYQLLQLLLKSERLDPPFIDQFVKYQLKEIYNFLNYSQKNMIKKIVLGKKIDSIDQTLINIGMVKESSGKYILFSSLMEDYVRNNVLQKFSLKEARFYKLLKDNLGKVVSSKDIFELVWREKPEEATDWALSSLLYRLRKHPLVVNQGYFIESHKKMGYRMMKD